MEQFKSISPRSVMREPSLSLESRTCPGRSSCASSWSGWIGSSLQIAGACGARNFFACDPDRSYCNAADLASEGVVALRPWMLLQYDAKTGLKELHVECLGATNCLCFVSVLQDVLQNLAQLILLQGWGAHGSAWG